MTRSPAEAVHGLWQALQGRDYDAVADWVTDDCIYFDVALGAGLAAKGPANIANRLRSAWGTLATYEHHDGLLVADGDHVLYEHGETWTWRTGESMYLPFVSVHRVRDGRVSLWKDYWDNATLAGTAPAWWFEELATGDVSWVHDATGEV